MSLRPNIKINKIKNIYIKNTQFKAKFFIYLFFKNFFDNLVNSTKDKEKITIDTNK